MKNHFRLIKLSAWVGIIFLLTSVWAWCQEAKLPDRQNPATGATLEHPNPLDSYQFYLSLIVIGFGLFVISAQMLMLRRVSELNSDDIARNCVITLVTTAALVLVIAGYSSAQIAPAFGLFGTVVGYLLGRATRRANSESPNTGSGSTSGEVG